jgi:hypothetical protein
MSDIWLIESPVSMVEGEVIAFSVDWLGASKVESPSAAVYKDGADITDSVMVSGDSHVVSNNVVTYKKITAGSSDGGSSYVAAFEANVDNNTEVRKLLIRVVKASGES